MEIFDHKDLYSGEPPKESKPRKVRIIIPLLACAVLIFIIGLLSGMLVTKNKQVVVPPPMPPIDKSAFYDNLCTSVVEVTAGNLAGSGVIVNLKKGETVNPYIVTNYHVIKNANNNVTVQFYNTYTVVPATIIGYDEHHDIALLKTEKIPNMLSAAEISFTNPLRGDKVYAVGDNLNSGISLFDGIVANPHRMIDQPDENKRVPVIQVTAPINTGMSGGALFNEDGKLIGINTYQTVWIATPNGNRPVDGTGYSVSANIMYPLVMRMVNMYDNQTITDVKRVNMECPHTAAENELYFTQLSFRAVFSDDGLYVNLATPNVNFVGGELKVGDIIVKFGNLSITAKTTFTEVYSQLLKYTITDSVNNDNAFKLEIKRGEKIYKIAYDNIIPYDL